MPKEISVVKSRKLPIYILLAEDDPINCELIVEMLESIGCKTDVVSNGKELLASMNQKNYDLVLMNCNMPEINGLQAAAKIRQREKLSDKRTPIIAITANAMTDYRQKCLDAGMNDYLSKPFTQEQLHKKLLLWAC